MKTINYYIKFAVERKKITQEQAHQEISDIFVKAPSKYLRDLALRNYFENNNNNNLPEIDPINNFKE